MHDIARMYLYRFRIILRNKRVQGLIQSKGHNTRPLFFFARKTTSLTKGMLGVYKPAGASDERR